MKPKGGFYVWMAQDEKPEDNQAHPDNSMFNGSHPVLLMGFNINLTLT